MATLAEFFDQAVRFHQGGNWGQAEALYRHILQADPAQAEAFHLPALINLAVALKVQGKLEEAARCNQRALVIDPNHAGVHNNLGLTFKDLGRRNEAIICFRQALRLNPQYADALENLAGALWETGGFEEAIACYRQALRLNPESAIVLNNLGVALFSRGQVGEAIAHWRHALRIQPDYAKAQINLGNALRDQGQPDEAIRSYRHALCINPHQSDSHFNLGNALVKQGQFAEAIECFQQALRLNPAHADTHNNLGCALAGLKRMGEAAACYEQALAIDAKHRGALLNRGNLRLLQGDLTGGWPDYEMRLAQPGKVLPPYRQPRWDGPNVHPVAPNAVRVLPTFPHPRWDGSPLAGKTILLFAEQGLGDTIQFIRFAALVKERGGRVVFECQPALMQVLQGVAGVDQLLAAGQDLPPFDVQAPLLSLAGILGTTLATIPAQVPYLRPNSELVERWRSELEPLGGFKIGIVWQGSPTHENDRNRSVPLAQFAPLAEIPGVRLLSLQVGAGQEQLAHVSFPVIDLGSRFDPGSLHDLAEVLPNLDLVVTVDTLVVHLAGALAIPAWVALPFSPDWRWLLDRADSPWYPTLRLFRQNKLDDWREVFESMAAEVRAVVK